MAPGRHPTRRFARRGPRAQVRPRNTVCIEPPTLVLDALGTRTPRTLSLLIAAASASASAMPADPCPRPRRGGPSDAPFGPAAPHTCGMRPRRAGAPPRRAARQAGLHPATRIVPCKPRRVPARPPMRSSAASSAGRRMIASRASSDLVSQPGGAVEEANVIEQTTDRRGAQRDSRHTIEESESTGVEHVRRTRHGVPRCARAVAEHTGLRLRRDRRARGKSRARSPPSRRRACARLTVADHGRVRVDARPRCPHAMSDLHATARRWPRC